MIAALLLLLVVDGPPALVSEAGVARVAAAQFAQGERAFRAGDFTAAALAFDRAAKLAPHAAAFLNSAEAWERSGQRARAAERCGQVLTIPGTSAAHLDEASKRLERLAPKVARLELSGSTDLEVEIDADGDRRVLPTIAYAEPGRRMLAVSSRSGQGSMTRWVVAKAGRTRKIHLAVSASGDEPPISAEDLADEPDPEPIALSVAPSDANPSLVAEGPARPGPPVLTWAFMGVTGAGLAATAILGGLTLDAKATYDQQPSQSAADVFFDRRLATNVVLTITLSAAAATVLSWLLDPAEPPGPNGAAGNATW